MDLELSDDQVTLRDEFRRYLGDRLDPETRRACAEQPGAVDRGLWKDLAAMGVFALTRPERAGGTGLGFAEATIVFEELGRVAAPGPLVATFLAAGLDADLSDGAASGELVVGAVLDTTPAVVGNLGALDRLLVLGEDIRVTDPPAGRPLDRPLDPLTPVHLVEELPAGTRVFDGDAVHTFLERASLLTAAMQVGLGDAAVELATGYAKERMQFGRSIGSFQAVKHQLADAHVGVDVARAAVHAAAVELDEESSGTCGVDAARVVASAAAARAAAACIQVHGGMGYTWEVDAHLFLKRSAVLDVELGSVEDAVERRAELLATGGGA